MGLFKKNESDVTTELQNLIAARTQRLADEVTQAEAEVTRMEAEQERAESDFARWGRTDDPERGWARVTAARDRKAQAELVLKQAIQARDDDAENKARPGFNKTVAVLEERTRVARATAEMLDSETKEIVKLYLELSSKWIPKVLGRVREQNDAALDARHTASTLGIDVYVPTLTEGLAQRRINAAIAKAAQKARIDLRDTRVADFLRPDISGAIEDLPNEMAVEA